MNYDDGDPENDRVVGVWADDVTAQSHYTDYTLDVTEQGIKLIQGELWGDMNIGNFRWGDKDAGESLGRIRLQRYQTDSQLVVMAGGAGGASCIGGTGSTQADCESMGGYWVNKGEQGVTIAVKQNWMERNGEKVNALTWENNRINGQDNTGTQVILDNMTTSDGYTGAGNLHGMQVTLAVDVAPTKVLNKNNPDEEKIMTGPDTYIYKEMALLTEQDKENRPMGFAVSSQMQFKELKIESIQMKHPNHPNRSDTLIHGLSLQNFNLTTNLTATPIQ